VDACFSRFCFPHASVQVAFSYSGVSVFFMEGKGKGR
jgi:hypothetical protein